MRCQRARDLLIESPDAADGDAVGEHLRACPECARFAARRTLAREHFSAHHADLEPHPAFAVRVVAALPKRRVDLLGWAALRVLPAACALVLVLAAWAIALLPDPALHFPDSVLTEASGGMLFLELGTESTP